MNFKSTWSILFLFPAILATSSLRAQSQEISLSPTSNAASLPNYAKGVNLAGGEYAPGPNGVYGTAYMYPTTQEFDYYKSKGFSIVRLPFDIARLQPASMSALNQSELAHITAAVEYARQIGMYIILDPHNYGKMWDQQMNGYQPIGPSPYVIPDSYFADFWRRLSTVYKNYPNVIYGLMNEPNMQSPTSWKTSAVTAINAIRTVSTTQVIFIPGTAFTTAATWVTSGNAAAWTGYKDPAGGPFAFEMHQYLDSNYSGTSSQCVTGYGSTVLKDATNWLAANGYRGFIGEFDWFNDFGQSGGTVSSQCQTEGTALLNAMQAAPQQWSGWTWWGSGPWAWNNGVNLDPGADGKAGDQPQTATLVQYLTANTGSLTTDTSSQTASTSAPTTSTSSQTTNTSSQTASTSAPTTNTSTQTTSASAPTTSTSSPTTNTSRHRRHRAQ